MCYNGFGDEMVNLDKIYKYSRIILGIICFAIFIVILRNEGEFMIIAALLGLITYALSFCTIGISKAIIRTGNRFNTVLKLLYYVIILPAIIVGIGVLFFMITSVAGDSLPETNDLATGLSNAIGFLLLAIIGMIFIVLPYFQTLIVLLLMKVCKYKNTN